MFDAHFRYGRRLDLVNPQTLADKISWLELNGDRETMARLTDKFEVRGYVAEKGLSDALIPLCGGPWTSADDINVDALPHQFVLKATHGCEMNYICRDKSTLNVDDMVTHAQRWLASDYSRACVEPHYKLIPHRIYAERYIGGMDGVIDYKFHCLNGVPSFVLTCSNREKSLKLNLYDLDWNAIEGLQGSMKNAAGIARPSALSEMVDMARTLSSDFDFVRVDLYERGGKVYFGELTFSPAVGVLPYFTDEFIKRWGEVLQIGRKQN
ncbi:ATP-grasp fold amidoligase family protein [Olsenella sp. Marseille-QA0557]|uniref:ATP-grasp fold amidoligase family protein n=1 Tax=Olsenella sp. Marseille-QA0557 TaxID=3378782 RepID=UPI003D14B8A7